MNPNNTKQIKMKIAYDILKRKLENKTQLSNQCLVKCEGWPDKYNQCIEEKYITDPNASNQYP